MEDDAPPLPVDILLEIAARSDPVTLVRCAAACRALRHGAAAPAFLRDGLRRHAPEGLFLPALLLGFFRQRRYRGAPRFIDPRHPRGAPPPEPLRSFLSENTDLFEFYAPAAARGGLVALRASTNPDEEPPANGGAGVCDPMAGFLDLLDPPGISAHSYVLFTDDCDGIGCRFRLLAANLSALAYRRGSCLQTQAYSSDVGSWGAITKTWVPDMPPGAMFVRPAALVLAGVAHWLCTSSDHKYFVLAFSARDASTSVTIIRAEEEEEEDGHCRRLHGCKPEDLRLVSSVDGRVSLLVAEEGLGISRWTAPPADTAGIWSRQVIVDAAKLRQAAEPWDVRPWNGKLGLRWFGEKSGILVARKAAQLDGRFFYFAVNVKSKRIRKVCVQSERDVQVFFPYEMGIAFWRPNISPKNV